MKQIFFDTFIAVVVAVTVWYVYTNYHEQIYTFLFGEQEHVIYIDDLALSVTVADEQSERQQGLSGVAELDEFTGKLFIFPTAGHYSIWMKDMNFPLDLIWVDNNFKIIHIEEQVQPESFPKQFVSDEPARFVLEVNSFFVDTYKINEGDVILLPPTLIPADIAPNL